MTSADLERRVRQHDNDISAIDISAIYEMISEVQKTQEIHTRRFDGIDTRLDTMDKRFDGIDTRLDTMDKRFDGIDTRLDALQGTLTEVLDLVRGDRDA